jgi:hypothetical protein
MNKKWVLSKLFLSIGGMQNARQTSSSEKSSACCLLAVEKSENSEESTLTEVYYIRYIIHFLQWFHNFFPLRICPGNFINSFGLCPIHSFECMSKCVERMNWKTCLSKQQVILYISNKVSFSICLAKNCMPFQKLCICLFLT